MAIVFYLLPAIAAVLTALQLYRRPSKPRMYVFSLFLSIIYALVVMFSSELPLAGIIPLMALAIIGTNMIFSYARHRVDFLIGASSALGGIAYLSMQATTQMAIEAFAVGSFVALVLNFGYYQKVSKENKKLEKQRDLFQILIGVVAILSFVLVQQYAYLAVFALVMTGYIIGGALSLYRPFRFLSSIERVGSVFGAGAIYMAVGTLLILGSIGDYNYILLSLVALLICDAIATIIGVHGRHSLPYNRNKTVEGTLAYFVVLGVVGFTLVSYYGLLFAAVLALLESALETIDDNIAVPIAAIVLYFII